MRPRNCFPCCKPPAAYRCGARDERPEDAGGPTLASGFAELDRELPGGGWPQGQLIELLTDDAGIGELSLLAPALAQLAQSRRCTVWVLPVDAARATSRRLTRKRHAAIPYAPALATAGLDLARTIFVKPATPREGLWAVEQSLRARHLGAVVGWLPPASGDGDFRALRRLHLLAQRHQALAFVLRSDAPGAGAFAGRAAAALASGGAQLASHAAEAARPPAARADHAGAAPRALGKRACRSRCRRAARAAGVECAARYAASAGRTAGLTATRLISGGQPPALHRGPVARPRPACAAAAAGRARARRHAAAWRSSKVRRSACR